MTDVETVPLADTDRGARRESRKFWGERRLTERRLTPRLATLSYWFRDFSSDRRSELAEKGHALPDGSFPIVNTHDLRNAIRAYGRSRDKPAAKAHIVKRAKALGATHLLPSSWSDGDGEAKAAHEAPGTQGRGWAHNNVQGKKGFQSLARAATEEPVSFESQWERSTMGESGAGLASNETRKFWAGNNVSGKKGFQKTAGPEGDRMVDNNAGRVHPEMPPTQGEIDAHVSGGGAKSDRTGSRDAPGRPKMSNEDWENHIAESTADYSRGSSGFESRATAVLHGGELLGAVYDVGMGEPRALGRLETIMSNRPPAEMSTYNLELSHGGIGRVLSEFHQSRLSSRLEGHLAGKKSADALGIETDAKGATALRARLRDAGYSSTSGSGRGRSWTTHTKGSHRVIVTKHSGYAVDQGYAPFSVDSLNGG